MGKLWSGGAQSYQLGKLLREFVHDMIVYNIACMCVYICSCACGCVRMCICLRTYVLFVCVRMRARLCSATNLCMYECYMCERLSLLVCAELRRRPRSSPFLPPAHVRGQENARRAFQQLPSARLNSLRASFQNLLATRSDVAAALPWPIILQTPPINFLMQPLESNCGGAHNFIAQYHALFAAVPVSPGRTSGGAGFM